METRCSAGFRSPRPQPRPNPPRAQGPQRALCAVHLPRLLGGRPRPVHVFNLHLGLAGFERLWQLTRFFADSPFAGLAPGAPVIVGGDFNDVWGRIGRTFFEPAGFHVPERPARTFRPGLPCGRRRNLRPRRPARAPPVPFAPARSTIRLGSPPLYAELELV